MEQIPKTLKTQSSLEEKMFAELSELIKTQSDQVTRTVAYSTNQVLKLHQDLTNISKSLMTVNDSGGLNNVTVTTTVSLMTYHRYIRKYDYNITLCLLYGYTGDP